MSRLYTLNEKYFDVIESPNQAYFFGFLMADGYNNEKRGAIELSCSPKDEEILLKLNTLIGSNKPLRFVNSSGVQSYRIDWCSRRLSLKLAQMGCVQNKSLKLEFPILDSRLVKPFILGYFDGDGCISSSLSKRNNIFNNSLNSMATITSTENFCLFLKRYFLTNLEINSTMLCRHPENNNSNRTLQISGNKQVCKLMEWLYEGATLFLDRKHQRFIGIRNEIVLRRDMWAKIKKDKRAKRYVSVT